MNIITTAEPLVAAAEQTAASIRREVLAGRSVLWLLSGGSSLTIATLAAAGLRDLNLERVYVTMTDERYGDMGHADENWQQLLDSGFELPGAQLYRPLTGDSLEDTVAHFNHWLDETHAHIDYTLGIFGIGPDGHTAGIKPHSPAILSQHMAEAYQAEDFTRITITPHLIMECDEVIIQASGDDKESVLRQWLTTDMPFGEQPAQALKSVANATLYTTNNLGDN